jgi:tetratricopeptide (TPR) repeat protein
MALCGLLIVLGCTSMRPGKATMSSEPQAAGEQTASSPPDRRTLPLAAIVPAPSLPAEGSSVSPLSERGAAQIAAAAPLMAEQRFTEASLELEKALRFDPGHPDVHRTLASLHLQAGNKDRARQHIAKALELAPTDETAHYVSGRIAQSEGDASAAILSFRTSLLCPEGRRDPETTLLTHYHLAEALHADGYETAALEQFDLFELNSARLSGPPKNPELAALLRVAPIAVGKARAEALTGLGRPSEAADALRTAVAAAPQDSALAVMRARLLLQAGRHDEALAAARDMPLDSPETLRLLMDIHAARGTSTELIDELKVRLQQRPAEQWLVSALADLLDGAGRHDETITLLQQQLRVHPEAIDVRLRLMDALQDSLRWDEFLAAAGEGLALHDARAAELEARVLTLSKEPSDISSLLDKPSPTDAAPVTYLRGLLARDTGRWQQAERLFSSAIEKDTGFTAARVALARMYMNAYDYDKAMTVAARRDADVAEDSRLELILGEIFERMDEPDTAEIYWNAALQLDRRNASAMLHLAYL